MTDTTDPFIYKILHIIHAMKNIFLPSQKTSVRFFLYHQRSKLVPLGKACNSNWFSLKRGLQKWF